MIHYNELEEMYTDDLETSARCPHENARVIRDGNAITVYCGHCGLYGVMAVDAARRLGWIE